MSRFPERRPAGLRLAPSSPTWWRIDEARPEDWSWSPFPTALHRFDSPSGRFRVRYAANDPIAAARERFPGRRLAEEHGELMLVRLDDAPRSLHLTHQRTLDALGLDDRINTGRLDAPAEGDPLLAVSQELADRVWDWWNGAPPPLVYRTRLMPAARSMAFHEHTAWTTIVARPLAEAQALLVELVFHHGFDVPDAWLS